MLILPMISPYAYQIPPIGFNQGDHLSHLHLSFSGR
jgi:hypothetical protein